jgi:DNA topoisomerase-3
MATVIVAEKPSVARDIARVVGARVRGDGCLHGNGYVVTWALGHLIHLAEPSAYGPLWEGHWSLAQLPMVPEQWKLTTHKSTAQQYKVVKRHLTDPQTDSVICATDAGREGEHIFRLIYRHARCRKPFRRLWISSLTDQAISQGLKKLQAGADFDDLAKAAEARAQADWLVGLNLTRAYTVHHGTLFTIGRVQTPTLAMIIQREAEIDRFVKGYFYELLAHVREGFTAKYLEDGKTRLEDKQYAETLHRQLSPHKEGTVVSVDQKIKKERPPALYDLLGLQRTANSRFGFSAARVLEYAQALYETHKLITYPRTESRHISEDMVPTLPGILEKLEHPQTPAALERWRQGHRLGKAYVDKTKLSDHHGILPTGTSVLPTLAAPLRKVFDLVVARFVGMFLPDHEVEETEVKLDVGGACFVAKGAKVLTQGWKVVEPADSEERTVLPGLTKGQQVHIDKMEVAERETSPPKRFTDATLLGAMRNAGRRLEDEALSAVMKESGLGTSATRAEIIERLIRSEYIERQKKNLAPTEKGKALIGVVSPALCSPELTAQWERKLQEIENGRLGSDAFYPEIVSFVSEQVAGVSQRPVLTGVQTAKQSKGGPGEVQASQGPALGRCPQCSEGNVVESAKAYGCDRYRQGCRFTIWKTVARKKLTAKQATELIGKGRTGVIKGFKSKAGKPFNAGLVLNKEFTVEFDFNGSPKGNKTAPLNAPSKDNKPEPSKTTLEEPVGCPKCGQGRIIEGKRGFGCHRFREGCDFVVWKEIAGKRLTQKQIYRLIRQGKTSLLSGFIDSSGRAYKARLTLSKGWEVTMEGQNNE